MRSHSHLGDRFSRSTNWNFSHGTRGEVTNIIKSPEGSTHAWTAFSHSGKERNRTFLNLADGSFANASGISGADSISDSRSFVIWDFNRDGRQDIAVVNANRPLLQIFANRSGEFSKQNNFVAVRLVGAPPSGRDAIGARISFNIGEETILRTLSAGEGFASQNSKTMIVGIGSESSVHSAQLRWPSGNIQQIGPIPEGMLAIIDEASGEMVLGPYRPPSTNVDRRN